MSKQLILFSTSHCHLCELAEALLAEFAPVIAVKIVDIADDEALLALYGTRIPVLLRTDIKTELNWPFTAHEIAEFLSNKKAS